MSAREEVSRETGVRDEQRKDPHAEAGEDVHDEFVSVVAETIDVPYEQAVRDRGCDEYRGHDPYSMGQPFHRDVECDDRHDDQPGKEQPSLARVEDVLDAAGESVAEPDGPEVVEPEGERAARREDEVEVSQRLAE